MVVLIEAASCVKCPELRQVGIVTCCLVCVLVAQGVFLTLIAAYYRVRSWSLSSDTGSHES